MRTLVSIVLYLKAYLYRIIGLNVIFSSMMWVMFYADWVTSDGFPQEEKEQLIKYRSSVASLVGRAKTVVQLRPRSAEYVLDSATPIRCICDYKQIEVWPI